MIPDNIWHIRGTIAVWAVSMDKRTWHRMDMGSGIILLFARFWIYGNSKNFRHLLNRFVRELCRHPRLKHGDGRLLAANHARKGRLVVALRLARLLETEANLF